VQGENVRLPGKSLARLMAKGCYSSGVDHGISTERNKPIIQLPIIT
jgi:hypothetical protein